MKPADRDQAIDRALPHALRAGSARASDACPDAETVAAWAARTLPPAERESLDTHLADCARCQALLAAFARAEPEPAPSSSPWATWRLPWLIPVATAATALAIWVATPQPPPAEFAPASQRMDDSAAAPPAG